MTYCIFVSLYVYIYSSKWIRGLVQRTEAALTHPGGHPNYIPRVPIRLNSKFLSISASCNLIGVQSMESSWSTLYKNPGWRSWGTTGRRRYLPGLRGGHDLTHLFIHSVTIFECLYPTDTRGEPSRNVHREK